LINSQLVTPSTRGDC